MADFDREQWEKAKRQVRRADKTIWVHIATIVAALIFGTAGWEDYLLVLFIPLISATGYVIYTKETYWRCPACNERLPMREGVDKIKHCPSCGVKLSD